MISMNCPTCQGALQIPEQYAGQAGKCNKCGAHIVAPTLEAGTPSGVPDDLAAALEASLNRERPKPVVRVPSLGERLQPLVKPVGMGLGVIAVIVIVMAALPYLGKMGTARRATPEEVTRSFMEASKSGNMAQCQPYVTAKSWELLGLAPTPPAGMPTLESYSLGTASISGANAEVAVQVTQLGMTVNNTVLLRQDASDWRIYGVRVAPAPGMEMTINFENPQALAGEMQKLMENMSPEMMQQMQRAMQQPGGFPR